MTALNSAESRLTGLSSARTSTPPKPFTSGNSRCGPPRAGRPKWRGGSRGRRRNDRLPMAIDHPGRRARVLQVRDYRKLAMLVEAAPRALPDVI